MTTTHTSSAAVQAAPNLDSSIFTFREAANQNELEQLLKLRFRCFTQGIWEMKELIEKNPFQLDFDAYDEKALHFGLFLTQNKTEIPAAYVRFVTIGETRHSVWIKNIQAKYPSVKVKATKNNFPFQDRMDEKMLGIANDFIQNQEKNGLNVIETSRVCIDSRFSTLRLCDFLITACAAFTMEVQQNTISIYIIREGTEKSFTSCGGQRIEGLNAVVCGLNFNVYFTNNNIILPNKRSKINTFCQLFLQNRCIRFEEKEKNYF